MPYGFVSNPIAKFNSSITSTSSVSTSDVSDSLPLQQKSVSATGQVVPCPCKIMSIRCISGTTPSIIIRDVVTQNQTDTDTTSPILFSQTMNPGDIVKLPIMASFGAHATLGGTTPVFVLEF
jgi:hypothetical protein